jgi:hypothetical protein
MAVARRLTTLEAKLANHTAADPAQVVADAL